jgi:hypothetical protein
MLVCDVMASCPLFVCLGSVLSSSIPDIGVIMSASLSVYRSLYADYVEHYIYLL